MKTPEDEAFDDLARKQGAWGGGFKAKQAMAADKLQEPVCDKDPQGCWNVRCQLGKQCKNLAQPAQEPVALVIDGVLVKSALPEKYTGHLYTTPPQPAQLAHIAQFMKELRPAIGPVATMGKSKTTQEWFDIVINEIERLQATQEKNT